jgi:tetratricopeptide (TPR) repeat protein
MQAQFNQAQSFHQAGNFKQAETIYRQLLHNETSHPIINARLGLLLHQTNRKAEALSFYKVAINALPNEYDLLMQGVETATQLSENELAESWLRIAISIKPNDVEALEQLSGVLIGNHRENDALGVLKAVIRLSPDNAGAYNLKGLALSRLGDTEKGYKAFQKSVKMNPGQLAVVRNLILYGKGKKEPILESLIPQFELRVNQGGQADIVQMNMAYILSMYFEKKSNGKYYSPDKAFRYLKIANDLSQKSKPYHHKNTQQTFSKLISFFSESFKEAFKGAGLKDASPIFILGMPRSGTTLVEQILSGHSLVAAEGEITDLSQSMSVHQFIGKDQTEAAAVSDCLDTVKLYLDRVRTRQSSAHFTDKMPYNFMFVGLIALALPKAKIIHCTRDPLETCFSIYKQNFSGNHAYSNDLVGLGQYYNLYQSLMAHWTSLFSKQVYEANYERIVEDSEQEIGALLDYCGLEREPACFEFYKNKRAVRTASVSQVRQPIYRDSMKASTPYLGYLKPLIDILDSGEVKG